MKKLLFIFMTINFVTSGLYSQNKIVKGKVISEFFETIPKVSIIINDTLEVGKTNFDGFFQVEIPVSVKNISFNFIGFDPTAIENFDKCNQVEVVMMLSGTYDFISLKKVDRLRIKKFKNLPELHKQAIEQGIFKIDKPCYSQVFISYNNKKIKSSN